MKKRNLFLTLGILTSFAIIGKRKIQKPRIHLDGNYPELDKVQHAVFYVKDLNESQSFYEAIFDIQYSATNHPDSSAAMNMVGHTMKFFSFGYYHHDICFVQNPNVTVDEEQWSHFTVKLDEGITLDQIKERLSKLNVPYKEGHVLPQLIEDHTEVIHFNDPNGHQIEVVA